MTNRAMAGQQMCANALHKEPQYLDGEQNILIFVSHSESLISFFHLP